MALSPGLVHNLVRGFTFAFAQKSLSFRIKIKKKKKQKIRRRVAVLFYEDRAQCLHWVTHGVLF